MTDFGKKGKFFDKSVSKAHFLSITKKIREEIFEDSKTLFLDPDLSHRRQAFYDLKNLKGKYEGLLKSVGLTQRKQIAHAIDIDNHKIENALKFAHVIPYLDLEMGHVPLLDAVTGKPFTLYEYLQDPKLLSEREVIFELHISPQKISSYLPGIQDPALLKSLEKGGEAHLLFEKDGIKYDIQCKGAKRVFIKGKCLLKNLVHSIKYELPPSENPGDINWEMDRLLREGKR